MPSRNVVLAYIRGGGVTLLAAVPATDHDTPPSVDRSTEIVTQQNPLRGSKFVSVVHTEPSGATCGSRYVAPCGLCGGCGSGCGADQSVCVPSGRASA